MGKILRPCSGQGSVHGSAENRSGGFERTASSRWVVHLVTLRVERFSLGGVARGLVGLSGEAVLHAVVELATVVTLLLGVGGVPVGVVSVLGILAFSLAAAVALLVSVVGSRTVVLLHEVDEHLFQRGFRGLLGLDGEHLGFLGCGIKVILSPVSSMFLRISMSMASKLASVSSAIVLTP